MSKSYADRIAPVGPATGICNICERVGALTKDHIPPAGIRRVPQAVMRNLVDRLSAHPAQAKFELSQGGVKFRSLCSDCNNGRLGKYDRALCDFAAAVDRVCTSVLSLPATISVAVRPKAVVRAVVGHLLAFGAARPPLGPFNTALASYFLDESLILPRGIDCFYWVYPYNDQVIVRDAVYMPRLGSGQFAIMTIKFFPLAFLLTSERAAPLPFGIRRLPDATMGLIDQSLDIEVDLVGMPPQRWPEAPTEDGATMHGGNPLHATYLGAF